MVNVRHFLLFLFISFLPVYLLAADVKVDVSINQDSAFEKQPLVGSLAITHDNNDKVDEKSIRFGDKPLPVEFVQETKISPFSPLVISFYRFTIEGQSKGLHILPSLKVTVGGHAYQSLPTTYEVDETAVQTKKAPTKTSATTSTGKVLRLESIVQGPSQLYPGQRIKVIYRYIFNDNVELTKEVLPLLQGEGFLKVGAPEVKDENQGAVSIREVSQVLEAIKPGEYKFDTSHIEGYVYRNDPFGSRIYIKPMLQADATTKTITVSPFPAQGKPASFNGAIGSFSNFAAHLKTPDHLNVGDKLVLELDLTGSGQLEQAPVPELCCLPGFSGVFSQSDIPPKEEIKGPTKTFFVEMRPLTAHVKEVPIIEYAYFNPQTKSYGILKSQAIPIIVKALPVQPAQPAQKEEAATQEWKQFSKVPGPIEIYGNKKLRPSDMLNYLFGQWWVLLLVPLAGAALILQLYLRKYWQNYKPAVPLKTSELYFSEAMRAGPTSNAFYQLLNKALILRLVEKGKLKDPQTPLEKLPSEGLAGEVKALLTRIEEMRFTGQKSVVDDKLIEEAKVLFHKI